MSQSSDRLTVIIGDLVHSRKLSNRRYLPRRIRAATRKVSQDFKREIVAPLMLTKGIDELSGVLRRSDHSYRICSRLNDIMKPVEFRFVIVRGTLDVAISKRDAREMDGEAFHRAAALMRRAKRARQFYRFALGPQFDELNEWISEMANLVHVIKRTWTHRQEKLVDLYRDLGTQKEVAGRLNITQQAVSDALAQAQWREVSRAEALIQKALGGSSTTS